MGKNRVFLGITKVLARIIFPKPKIIYEEPLVEGEGAVFTANHSGAFGPATVAQYYPTPCRPWSVAQVLKKETAAKFVFYDFFAGAGKKHKKFWLFLAHITAGLLRPILIGAGGIPVHHDRNMDKTFEESIESLNKGMNITIFPECPEKFSNHINDFYSGFVYLGLLYYRRTGKKLKFYPSYIAHPLKTVLVGRPIEYDPEIPVKIQRANIAKALRDRTEELARSLPEHSVQPFLTEEWYAAYGHYWKENRMAEYWSLSERAN